MNSIKRSDNQTIHDILSRKYRSMILLIGVLLVGLWLSLSAYVLNGLYREAMNRMYNWALVNKSRLEEALFLKNYESIGFRLTQVADLTDKLTNTEMSLYDPEKKPLTGALKFPQCKEGLGFSVLGMRIQYFDTLTFAGNRVGYLYLRSQFKPAILIAVVVFIFAVCMGLFLAVLRLLSSFMSTLERRIVAPIENLRESMNRFDLGDNQELMAAKTNYQPAAELADLYDGYNSLVGRIRQYSEIEVRKAESDAEVRLAAQVAHDIRSPLAALKTAAASLTNVPEDSRKLIRLAVDRIHDIANNLIEGNRRAVSEGGPIDEKAGDIVQNESLLILLEEIIAEKRAEFSARGNTEVRFIPTVDNYPLFAQLNIREFKRMMSNLINNAAEASVPERPSSILIRLAPQGAMLEVCIEDNGRGIPEEVLPQLAKRGFSYDKPKGTGLGLHHGRSTVENWGGSLLIESKLGVGTNVRMFLPRGSPPHWFLPSIDIRPGERIVIVDDDPSIHQLWRTRFRNLPQGETVQLTHLYTPSELKLWTAEENDAEARLLVDYEFSGHASNGLALIESLGLARRAVLVTGRYGETEIRSECNRLDVRLLPKTLAALIPIRVQGL